MRLAIVFCFLQFNVFAQMWKVHYTSEDSLKMDAQVHEKYVATKTNHFRIWIWKDGSYFKLKIRSLQTQRIVITFKQFLRTKSGDSDYLKLEYKMGFGTFEYRFKKFKLSRGFYECQLGIGGPYIHVYHFF